MRSRSFSLAFLLALVSFGASSAAAVDTNTTDAQDGKSELAVRTEGGAYVRIRTESVPPMAQDATSNLIETADKPNLIYRVFVDSKNELFFGYELLIEPVAATRQFRVAVRPLGEEYLQNLRARPAFRNRSLHPSYNAAAFSTAPQLVGDGDTFALDVLRNPRTGTKIVDVIQVSLADPSLQDSASEQPPRDFALEDVMLKVTNCKLLINGETVYRSPGGSLAGSVIWLALPQRGRFVFSLVPRPGYDFQKVAKVEHDRISFEWNGERFEWVSSEPVVGLGGNWNLWVLHDPNYALDLFDQKPAPPGDSDKTFSQQADEAARRMKERRAQAEFGSTPDSSQPKPAGKPRRMRVVIGAADGVEYLFPK